LINEEDGTEVHPMSPVDGLSSKQDGGAMEGILHNNIYFHNLCLGAFLVIFPIDLFILSAYEAVLKYQPF
jgi:hypothetical protein